jgi:hypothetical protein
MNLLPQLHGFELWPELDVEANDRIVDKTRFKQTFVNTGEVLRVARKAIECFDNYNVKDRSLALSMRHI